MHDANGANSSPASPSSALADLVDRLTAQLQAGEAVDWEAVEREHPEHAEELRRLRPALLALHQLSRSGDERLAGGVAPAPAPCAEPLPGALGDFRILREIGRGGMGVVYEAQQLSLKRRVALKVLSLAGLLDDTQLQRFHNEARAAAQLHHSNIPPVYAVGCERGVHFCATQYIDGQSLAAVLGQLRRPAAAAAGRPAADTPAAPVSPPAPAGANRAPGTRPARLLRAQAGPRGRDYFRAVADVGVQAADALDYGHRLGVVHRDIRPDNLLLDGAGRLWVTDFGLAPVQGAENLAATGELAGALRYMSPEQALARRAVIDHRTDVYSLGAALYELLTLRPPFVGADRQELLRQIAFDEPQLPRRLNRAVPPALEIVVLKAMEKAPPDRYATARELADDLRRWLDGRPVRARRPSWVRAAVRWARRLRLWSCPRPRCWP